MLFVVTKIKGTYRYRCTLQLSEQLAYCCCSCCNNRKWSLGSYRFFLLLLSRSGRTWFCSIWRKYCL